MTQGGWVRPRGELFSPLLTLAGVGVGGEVLKGVQMALGMVRVVNNGWMIGLINIVRDNPRYLRVLPIMNANF